MDFSASGYIQPITSGYLENTPSGIFFVPSSGISFGCGSTATTSNFCRSTGTCSLPSGIIFQVSGSIANPIGLGPFQLTNRLYTDSLKVWQSDSIQGANNFNFDFTIPLTVGTTTYCTTITNLYYGISDKVLISDPLTHCKNIPTICQIECVAVTGPPHPCNIDVIRPIPNCSRTPAGEMGNLSFTGHWTLTLDTFANIGSSSSGCSWTGHLDFNVEQTLINGSQVPGDIVYRNKAYVVNIANSGILPSGSCLQLFPNGISNTAISICSGLYVAINNDDIANLGTGSDGLFNNLSYVPNTLFGTANTVPGIFYNSHVPSGSRWVLNVV